MLYFFLNINGFRNKLVSISDSFECIEIKMGLNIDKNKFDCEDVQFYICSGCGKIQWQ